MKISQEEFASIRRLYEGVMSYACHGLFFREGSALAEEIAKEAAGEDVLSKARESLVARGWVEDITFDVGEARVKGSVEVSPGSEIETCHRLRGVVSKMYELTTGQKRRFAEVECESTGGGACVFRPTEEG